ncbi:hypothetical protein FSBG_00087 [Fusobacterium gonidiaformans 3-1-5R]|mgnify:CR=1 FL=1|uniref:Uncharacterized protein n=1 Tax=Fusobacterium gonidiaformans 3-1-5R TaxID=469605 RepID=E5BEQ9_9FUSO|nr:hypothetical protein [Fusobacterium gonidiaformans]EFS20590.1 hypothetical protein FSBG_00087 [Fusobacterium gonidiaformans 3-1-5R]MCF0163298.1 hypothetical protein [Fusobacterium necrophorum]
MSEKKRKGYSTIEQQMRANKEYLDRNPEAKERGNRSRLKSTCKRFIRDFATLEELEEIKVLIAERSTKK